MISAATTAHLELVPCGLCGADDFSVLYNSPMRLPSSQEVADFMASTDRFDHYGQIVRCRKCGLVYTNPRPVAKKIESGYEQASDDDYLSEDSSRSMNAHISLMTIKKFARGGRLLEVGCSAGLFLNAARLDFDVAGLELSRWAVKQAKEKLRLDVAQGALDQTDLPPEGFDVVALIDVIEHLTDPAAALRKIQRALKPGGLLYLVTPNIESFSARVLRGKWWGLRPAHIYYFSPKTLSEILVRAGFEVRLTRSYGRIFTYGYWLSRLVSYPAPVRSLIGFFIRLFRLEEKILYLNTRDSMEVCAQKLGS